MKSLQTFFVLGVLALVFAMLCGCDGPAQVAPENSSSKPKPDKINNVFVPSNKP